MLFMTPRRRFAAARKSTNGSAAAADTHSRTTPVTGTVAQSEAPSPGGFGLRDSTLVRRADRLRVGVSARPGRPRGALDDAAQEVFLVVHRRLRRVPRRVEPAPWLYSIVRNVRLDSAAPATAQRPRRVTTRLAEHGPTPLERVQDQQAAAFVARFLAGVSDKQARRVRARDRRADERARGRRNARHPAQHRVHAAARRATRFQAGAVPPSRLIDGRRRRRRRDARSRADVQGARRGCRRARPSGTRLSADAAGTERGAAGAAYASAHAGASWRCSALALWIAMRAPLVDRGRVGRDRGTTRVGAAGACCAVQRAGDAEPSPHVRLRPDAVSDSDTGSGSESVSESESDSESEADAAEGTHQRHAGASSRNAVARTTARCGARPGQPPEISRAPIRDRSRLAEEITTMRRVERALREQRTAARARTVVRARLRRAQRHADARRQAAFAIARCIAGLASAVQLAAEFASHYPNSPYVARCARSVPDQLAATDWPAPETHE